MEIDVQGAAQPADFRGRQRRVARALQGVGAAGNRQSVECVQVMAAGVGEEERAGVGAVDV